MKIIKDSNTRQLTGYVVKKIKEIKSENINDKIMLIVPDQFSYTYEKIITKMFGGTGLNGIEVMTFSRLCSKNLSFSKNSYLSKSGKTVLIQKAIYEISKDEKNVYKNLAECSGFCDKMQNAISEFSRYMITPEDLLELSATVDNKILENKLVSLYSIYKNYLELTQNKYHDSENDLLYLSDKIKKTNLFSDCHIIIHEFSDYLPQHYVLIEDFIKFSKETYITLPEILEDNDYFEIINNTENRIKAICANNSVKIDYEKTGCTLDAFQSQEIQFYFDNFSNHSKKGFKKYPNKTEDIKVFASRDPYFEVEHSAKIIKTLIEDNGYKYSDIGVVLGNPDDYNHLVQAIYSDYNIPYFTDSKLPCVEHPLILSILSVFDIIDSNWSYDSVFRYLKSGFIYEKDEEGNISQINEKDVDLLEKYVLKRGIRGKKKWLSEIDWCYNKSSISQFEKENNDSNDKYSVIINKLRKKVTKPIEALIEAISGRRTVKEYCQALFQFLVDINLYEGISYEIAYFNSISKRNDAEQYQNVWNILIDCINQLVTTIGNDKCSKKEFKTYLLSAISGIDIELIPTSNDAVTVGTCDLARQKRVKAIIVLGCLRGYVPADCNDTNIISDKERETITSLLKNKNLEFGQTTKSIKLASGYRFYRVIFNASNKIFFSYPTNDFEGNAHIPSQFLYDLKKIFENLTIEDDLISNFDISLIGNSKSAIEYYIKNKNNQNDKNISIIENYFKNNEKWKSTFEAIEKADNYKQTPCKITEENAKDIFNKSSYSISAINKYSSCPFKYFISHGLSIKEEEIWGIQKFDLGSIMHYIICEYCKTIEGDSKTFEEVKDNWSNLTVEESNKIIDVIVKDTKKKVATNLDRDEAKVNYLFERMSKTIKRSVDTVRISIQNGEYITSEYEKNFYINLSNESPLAINGVIDRIDVAKDSENNGKIRIVDYKSGKKDFSVASISNMLDIQLVVYAMCSSNLFYKKQIKYLEDVNDAKVCGMLYSKLRDDFADTSYKDLIDTNNKISKIIKMNGVIILENDDDISNVIMMDKDLENNSESGFLNIRLKKDGLPYSNCDTQTRNEYDALVEYVKHNIILIDKKLKSGNIAITPYFETDSVNACNYCAMQEICMFDKKLDVVRCGYKDKNIAWDKINNLCDYDENITKASDDDDENDDE